MSVLVFILPLNPPLSFPFPTMVAFPNQLCACVHDREPKPPRQARPCIFPFAWQRAQAPMTGPGLVSFHVHSAASFIFNQFVFGSVSNFDLVLVSTSNVVILERVSTFLIWEAELHHIPCTCTIVGCVSTTEHLYVWCENVTRHIYATSTGRTQHWSCSLDHFTLACCRPSSSSVLFS
jgi:hypothetical protein